MRCIKSPQFCLSVKTQRAFAKFVMVKRDKRVFSCAYLQTINFIGLHLLLIVGEESSGFIEWQSVSVCLFLKQRKRKKRRGGKKPHNLSVYSEYQLFASQPAKSCSTARTLMPHYLKNYQHSLSCRVSLTSIAI